jgi:hypothetical protein
MKKLVRLFLALVTILIIIAGCGGGNGSGNNVNYSSDYYGMEKGFQLSYTANEVLSGGATAKGTLITTVIDEDNTKSNLGPVFEISNKITINGTSDYVSYVLKKTSTSEYYDWDSENAYDYSPDDDELLMINPIKKGELVSRDMGNPVKQEDVTVRAGTFNQAWLFNYTDPYTSIEIGSTEYDCTENSQFWFVPYLGEVKMVLVYTSNITNKVISTITVELTSSKKGATITSSAVKSMQPATFSTIKRNLFINN